ncbi:alanine--glyoxylate aminotransferase 2, mitochondrial-like, partial [Paramuricea clavata]
VLLFYLLYLAKRLFATGSACQKLLEMPPCDHQPEPYTGKTPEETLKTRKEKLSPTYYLYHPASPPVIHEGKMQWLWDSNNKRYLDLFGGIVTVGVGHCHPKVNAAVKAQMDKLWHTTQIYMHPNVHEYAERLTEKFPGDLKVCFFVNSGSEANDLALFLARHYTKNFDFISLRNSYHGASPYIMGVTAVGTWKFNHPVGFGVHQTMNADVYRGLWGGSKCRDSIAQTTRTCNCVEGQCEATGNYIAQFEDMLKHSCGQKVAGFIAEYIQGVGGSVQLPKGFLPKAYELIRARGGLCISDEVQTGFGRLGSSFWSFEDAGVVPDIVTMAKSIGNGYPLAAVVTTPEIASVMGEAIHFNTFGGNALGSAVGMAVLDAIEEDGTQQNSHVVGTHFLSELLKLRDEFEIVGDVRGKGFMLGLELVTDKESKNPLPAPDIVEIWDDIKDMGVLIGRGGLYGN